MKIHIVQHVPFEEPGAINDWAKTHGHQVRIINPAKDKIPNSSETDFLIVLGGPMSVHDEKEFPWLIDEKKALKSFIGENKKPLLGICLGAQLIANVLDGKVYHNTEKEIGWFNVDFKAIGFFKKLDMKKAQVFHWHGEAFELPPGAELLASSPVTPVQAFQYKDKVLALQFHPEMNSNALRALLKECACWINPENAYEQSEAEILKQSSDALPQSFRLLEQILSQLV